MACDAAVHETHHNVTADTLLDAMEKLSGGGGTDFRPAFEALAAHHGRKKWDLVIYFTDTYGVFPDVIPPFPVLWCVTVDSNRPPFGEVIMLR